MRTRSGSAAITGLAALLGLLAAGLPARAQLAFDVSLNTAGLSGTSGILAFDLTDGDGTANNTAIVSAFNTDGVLAGTNNVGGATGNLPGDVTITDSSFFNESAGGITLGSTTSFHLTLTNNSAGGAPDEFAFFLLDSTGTTSLVSTGDPTGSDALFIVDLTGAPGGAMTLFGSLTGGVGYSVTPSGPVEVPEPGAIALLGIGCIMALPLLRRRKQ